VLFDGLIGARLKPGTTKARRLRCCAARALPDRFDDWRMKLTRGSVSTSTTSLGARLAALVYLLGAAFSYFRLHDAGLTSV